jgi:hypothetical protein
VGVGPWAFESPFGTSLIPAVCKAAFLLGNKTRHGPRPGLMGMGDVQWAEGMRDSGPPVWVGLELSALEQNI